MELFKQELGTVFRLTNFRKSYLLTSLLMTVGITILICFVFLAEAVPRGSALYHLVRNAGIYLFFISFLAAYAGVYRLTGFADGSTGIARGTLWWTMKKVPWLMAGTLLVLLACLVIALVELGVSFLGYIPYLGPVLTGLLTVPFFALNLAALVVVVIVFFLLPPAINESADAPALVRDLRDGVLKNGINYFLYIVLSLSVVAICALAVVLFARYTGGITKALQWKIGITYPPILEKKLTADFFVTDLIAKITPRPDPIGAFRKYGMEIFDYIDILKRIIAYSYAVIISFLAAFPLAAYFSFTASVYRWIFKGQK